MSEYEVKPVKLCGVDIETSGVNVNIHSTIQIGIVLPNGKKLVSDLIPQEYLAIDPKALEVNGFTRERLMRAPFAPIVDEELSTTMCEAGYGEGDLTAVGFNVGSFDIPFIRKDLPKVAKFFSYRNLDLTALAIFYELQTGKSYRDLKDRLHEKIVIALGRDQRHDALYDAEASLVALKLFQTEVLELSS